MLILLLKTPRLTGSNFCECLVPLQYSNATHISHKLTETTINVHLKVTQHLFLDVLGHCTHLHWLQKSFFLMRAAATSVLAFAAASTGWGDATARVPNPSRPTPYPSPLTSVQANRNKVCSVRMERGKNRSQCL